MAEPVHDVAQLLELLTRAADELKAAHKALDTERSKHAETRKKLTNAQLELSDLKGVSLKPRMTPSGGTAATFGRSDDTLPPSRAGLQHVITNVAPLELQPPVQKEIEALLEKEKTRAERAEASLDGMNLSISALKSDAEESKKRADELEVKLTAATAECDTLKARLTELETASQELTTSHRQEVEALQARADQARRRDLESTARIMATFEEEISQLKAELEKQTAERQHVETQFNQAYREIESLMEQRDAAVKQLAEQNPQP